VSPPVRRGKLPAGLLWLAALWPAPVGGQPEAALTEVALPEAALPEAMAGLSPAGKGHVASVGSGHSLVLVDGRQVRLAGLLAPLPDAGDAIADGLARSAASALLLLAGEHELLLVPVVATPDRYGRLRAHLVRARDGLWLQAALLEAGYARVFTTPDTAAGAAALYAAEAKARRARRGLWSVARYRPQPATAVKAQPGRMAVVTGRVREAAKVGGTVYLNFGDDWRSDFTLRLHWPVRRRLPEPQRAADWWTGRKLEMRGMLERYNGPMITPSHSEQVRVLKGPTPAPAAGRDASRPAAAERPD